MLLALNPGEADLRFQGRTGIFAEEIRRLGSYHAWAATWPYLRDPWEREKGPNDHHRTRLAFLRRWFEDDALGLDDMVSFELFPWHSSRFKGRMVIDPAIIHEFVWEPIVELNVMAVFGFGSKWFELVEALGLPVIDRLGPGGRPYPSRVQSRTVWVAANPSGGYVVLEKHLGSAGPPSADEVVRLREALPKLRAH